MERLAGSHEWGGRRIAIALDKQSECGGTVAGV